MMRRQKIPAPGQQYTCAMCIYAPDPELYRQAATLANRTGLAISDKKPEQGTFLQLTRQGLVLCRLARRAGMQEIRVDFTTPAWTRRLQQVQKERLIQAMGRTNPKETSIVDATGGLGRDSFLLAAAGFTIRIFERNPILAALLANGLERTAGHATMETGSLITLHCEDARNFLETNRSVVDIVYLDPMFPPRKKSAKVKKELQTIQQIVGNDERDYEALFTLALQSAAHRVVVKRPKNGPRITNCRRPSYSLPGETIRFDIYLTGSADH